MMSGFQRVLSAFMPKEEDFFTLFQRLSDHTVEGATTLQDVSQSFDRLEYAVHKIDDIEHASDDVVHEIVDRLNSTFVTPLLMDREDIYRLAERVDDVTDHIKGVIDRFKTFEIKAPTRHCQKMAVLLFEAASLLRDNMYELQTLHPGCNEYCAKINELENEGDTVLKEALGVLFREEPDCREILKWKDIYEMLEEGLDRCEDAANLVEALVVKNA